MADPSAAHRADQQRDLPPLSFRATFRPETVNAEKRTVELIWTTGARVLRGFWESYYEELSLDPKHVRMERLNNGAPFLDSHDLYSGVAAVLGVVESAKLENKARGTATVRFALAEDDAEADKAFRKVKDGILQNISVGYRVYKYEKVEDGEGTIPVYRAVDWEPYELSLVPAGADDGAGTRSVEKRAPNPCIIVQRQEKPMEETKPVTTAAPAAATPTAPAAVTAPASAEETARAVAAERTRVTEIQAAVRIARMPEAFATEHVNKGTTTDEVRSLIFAELARRDSETRTESHVVSVPGGDEQDKFQRSAVAWLIEKGGATSVVAEASKKERSLAKVELDGGELRGLSLQDLARECLERRGVATRRLSTRQIIEKALTFRAGGQSTSDFAVLMENAIGKILLGGYTLAPHTWSEFCKEDSVSDFRPSPRYRTGQLGVLETVNEAGEFTRIAMPDGQRFSIQTGTKGKILALTRQTIINDDMGALSDAAQKLGRASQLSIEVDVFALLALNSGLGPTQSDSQPFFHSANRANVNGTASAITVAGINADSAIMAAQRDPNNQEYLDLAPAVLLVPYGLRGDANTINDAQYDPVDSKFQKPNYVRGMFRKVVGTPRLSGTRRYLFADPNVAAAIVVAFLEGQGNAPMLDSQDGWTVDGVEWKVRLDYQAQMFDPKGAVTNAGA